MFSWCLHCPERRRQRADAIPRLSHTFKVYQWTLGDGWISSVRVKTLLLGQKIFSSCLHSLVHKSFHLAHIKYHTNRIENAFLSLGMETNEFKQLTFNCLTVPFINWHSVLYVLTSVCYISASVYTLVWNFSWIFWEAPTSVQYHWWLHCSSYLILHCGPDN